MKSLAKRWEYRDEARAGLCAQMACAAHARKRHESSAFFLQPLPVLLQGGKGDGNLFQRGRPMDPRAGKGTGVFSKLRAGEGTGG